jgi:two-component system sensor histidine kinase DesK
MNKFIATWFTPAQDSSAAEDVRRGKSPWTDAVHLLWTGWIFITPLFGGGYTLRWVIITLCSYPVFLLLFAKTVVAPKRTSYRYALGMGVLSFVLLPWYPSGCSYFVYACVMLRTCRMDFRRYMAVLLLLNTIFVAITWRIGYPWAVMITMPGVTFVIAIIIYVERMSQEKDAALRLSHEEVRRLAATAERERIGRDLHDLLGHTLSLITLKLELSRKLFDRDVEAAKREVEDAEKVARHALAEVRAAVTGIRATDIAAELAAARLMLESSSVRLEHSVIPALPLETERGLSLVLREAVTNISRHALATRVQISFEIASSGLLFRIVDDGRGGIGEDGNGLCGMRERVRALGGSLSIDSPPGRGTTIAIQVPLAGAAQRSKIEADTLRREVESSSSPESVDNSHGFAGGHA